MHMLLTISMLVSAATACCTGTVLLQPCQRIQLTCLGPHAYHHVPWMLFRHHSPPLLLHAWRALGRVRPITKAEARHHTTGMSASASKARSERSKVGGQHCKATLQNYFINPASICTSRPTLQTRGHRLPLARGVSGRPCETGMSKHQGVVTLWPPAIHPCFEFGDLMCQSGCSMLHDGASIHSSGQIPECLHESCCMTLQWATWCCSCCGACSRLKTAARSRVKQQAPCA